MAEPRLMMDVRGTVPTWRVMHESLEAIVKLGEDRPMQYLQDAHFHTAVKIAELALDHVEDWEEKNHLDGLHPLSGDD